MRASAQGLDRNREHDRRGDHEYKAPGNDPTVEVEFAPDIGEGGNKEQLSLSGHSVLIKAFARS
jgi:hypothetical protein